MHSSSFVSLVVNSFVQLVRYIFTIPGVKIFLSERLNQDALESFFGKQRQRGGGSDNPNVSQFLSGTSSLRVQGSIALQPLRGNSRQYKRIAEKDLIAESTPLPKRKRKAGSLSAVST